jgi:hypothetical protein
MIATDVSCTLETSLGNVCLFTLVTNKGEHSFDMI